MTATLGYVDLGQIDLLVQDGFYANRTDLIRTAIRNQLNMHGDAVRQAISRKTLVLGIQHYSAQDLLAVQAAGVHSGLAAEAASDLPSALSAMKKPVIRTLVQTGSGVPTMVFHGDRDAIVHPGNAQGVIEASACSAAPVETLRVSGMGNKRQCTKHLYRDSAGDIIAERWEIHGAGHAWAGGTESGSYTDQAGPDATAEMLRFFFNYTLSSKQ